MVPEDKIPDEEFRGFIEYRPLWPKRAIPHPNSIFTYCTHDSQINLHVRLLFNLHRYRCNTPPFGMFSEALMRLTWIQFTLLNHSQLRTQAYCLWLLSMFVLLQFDIQPVIVCQPYLRYLSKLVSTIKFKVQIHTDWFSHFFKPDS